MIQMVRLTIELAQLCNHNVLRVCNDNLTTNVQHANTPTTLPFFRIAIAWSTSANQLKPLSFPPVPVATLYIMDLMLEMNGRPRTWRWRWDTVLNGGIT